MGPWLLSSQSQTKAPDEEPVPSVESHHKSSAVRGVTLGASSEWWESESTEWDRQSDSPPLTSSTEFACFSDATASKAACRNDPPRYRHTSTQACRRLQRQTSLRLALQIGCRSGPPVTAPVGPIDSIGLPQAFSTAISRHRPPAGLFKKDKYRAQMERDDYASAIVADPLQPSHS
ncbi:hypothetical protein NDU88_009318 [Pleurodeles waltl]|uniref:Uncharacterized protein n=1 Tax=Pleurodeles waltl TaxID=8319 RepID=A0AAV7PUV4_PLEWA|nr:hypothetical protein NDU88_009318 [Pleurodeles waltl]